MGKSYCGLAVLMLLTITVGCGRAPEPLQAVPRAPVAAEVIPAFGDIRDSREKKQAFFSFMSELLRQANAEVWQERQLVLALQERHESGQFSDADRALLEQIAAYYRVDVTEPIAEQTFAELLLRVDVVPMSLALAQSANESGWGTSRFARDGRNFFGIWCYTPGCGLKPGRQTAGATHEVRKFDSVLAGVRYYLQTINRGDSYAELREFRAAARTEQELASGEQLAGGLTRYSERGGAYVDELRSMIRFNQLASYEVDWSAWSGAAGD